MLALHAPKAREAELAPVSSSLRDPVFGKTDQYLQRKGAAEGRGGAPPLLKLVLLVLVPQDLGDYHDCEMFSLMGRKVPRACVL